MIISPAVIGSISSDLAAQMLAAVGRKIGKEFQGDTKRKALESVIRRCVVAFLRHANGTRPDLLRETETVLADFFTNAEVARELSVVLRGENVDVESLLEILGELGLCNESLPYLNWESGLNDFQAALLEEAAGEPSLQNTVLCNFAIKQLDALRDISVQVGELIKLQRPDMRERYLAYLVESNRYLRLVGLDIAELSSDGTDRALDLMNVYINLETPHPKTWLERDFDAAIKAGVALVRLRQPQSLTLPPKDGFIQAFNLDHHDRASAIEWITSSDTSRGLLLRAISARQLSLILGDAGSGKSTFVRHLVGCLAIHAILKQDQRQDPLVNLLGERVEEWLIECPELCGLTPILLQARDFGDWLHQERNRGPSSEVMPSKLWDFFTQQLRNQGLSDATDEIIQEAERGNVILVVDGLDEVEEQHQLATMKNIRAWLERYTQARAVLTCRNFSYQRSCVWPKLRISTIEVGEFSYEQQVNFLLAWHQEFVRKKLALQAESDLLFGQLIKGLKSPTIAEFARNPLLLTLVTLIHTHKGRLPDAEVKLYEETVSLLLWGWERAKPSTVDTKLNELLAQADRTESDLMRVIRQLAFEVHSGARRQVSGEQAREIFSKLHPSNSLDWAQRILEFLYLRSGLLVANGDGSWSFPHRRIQEYLAALHIAGSGSFVHLALELSRDKTWHEVLVLATEALVHIFGDLYSPLTLASELYSKVQPSAMTNLDTLSLLARVVLSVGRQRAGDTDLGKQLLGHIPITLAQTLATSRINWKRKIIIGEALDGIGDPRFDEEFYHLPKDGSLGFVRIPAGPFQMGFSGHKYLVSQQAELQSEFMISKYPVTISQFAEFLRESENTPLNLESTIGAGNLPVTSVCWEEAVVYCTWLEAKLLEDERTPPEICARLRQGWRLRPPSEAEWERASRGVNGRLYPWGDSFDPDKAAFKRKKLNAEGAVGWVPFRVPVGLIPEGATPEGVLDLCGSLWEWTITRTGTTRAHSEFPYAPYDKDDGREDGISHPSAYRVLKGGSADGLMERWAFFPSIALPQYGFRMVLSPNRIKAGSGATNPDAKKEDLEILYIHVPDFGDAEVDD